MSTLRVKAHAKINTLLHVGDKGDDGYHDICTELHALELHDVVAMSLADEMTLTCSVVELSGESNLAWKVIRLASELAEIPPMHIHIEKNIPIQAGLGGGSSDAAAVLRGLFKMWDVLLPNGAFTDIALACGTDVPFFADARAYAFATGRGTDLSLDEPPNDAPLNIAIAKPDVGVSTAAAYAALDELRRPRLFRFRRKRNEAAIIEVVGKVHNDFDDVAPEASKTLIANMMSRGAMASHLCGSGSAVYGIFGQMEDAQRAAAELAAEGYWAWAGKTLPEIEEPEWT